MFAQYIKEVGQFHKIMLFNLFRNVNSNLFVRLTRQRIWALLQHYTSKSYPNIGPQCDK